MYQALAQLQGALYQGMCGSYINGAVTFAQKNRLPVLNRSNMVGTDSQFAQVNSVWSFILYIGPL